MLDGLQIPSPGDLPNPGIRPASPMFAGGFFTTELPGRPESSSQVALAVKNPIANVGDRRDVGSILGLEDSLEKEVATHSSILAWRIPWTERPGGLWSIGLLRVRHD